MEHSLRRPDQSIRIWVDRNNVRHNSNIGRCILVALVRVVFERRCLAAVILLIKQAHGIGDITVYTIQINFKIICPDSPPTGVMAQMNDHQTYCPAATLPLNLSHTK